MEPEKELDSLALPAVTSQRRSLGRDSKDSRTSDTSRTAFAAMELKDYFKYTFEKKLLLYMPQQEKDHFTPATQMEQKLRELEEVEKARKAEKEEFRMRMESLAARRDEIVTREKQLKESLVKFDTFIKDNDVKLSRAKFKAGLEREMIRGKDKEIEKLVLEKAALVKQLENIKHQVSRFSRYNDFLRQVMKVAGGYEEPRAVITRHKTLTTLLQHLRGKERTRTAMVETLRQNIHVIRESFEDELMTMHNSITQLQKEFDKAVTEKLQWEREYDNILASAGDKALTIGNTLYAGRNMYRMVMKRMGYPAEEENFFEQMIPVHNFLYDLTHIVDDLRREAKVQAAKELQLSQAQAAKELQLNQAHAAKEHQLNKAHAAKEHQLSHGK